MKKIKNWLINNFLPLWAKETVLADNRILKRKVERLKMELKTLKNKVFEFTVSCEDQNTVYATFPDGLRLIFRDGEYSGWYLTGKEE